VQKPFQPIDPGGDLDAVAEEELRSRRQTRVIIGLLVIAGLLGIWVMFTTLWPAASDTPVPAAIPNDIPVHQAAGTIAAPAATVDVPPPETITAPVATPPTLPVGAPTAPTDVPATPTAADKAVAPAKTGTAQPQPEATAVTSQPAKGKTDNQDVFGVQMGVFRVSANADKLYARMQAQGLPVLLEVRPGETRVHAGPFASRAAAVAMRTRLETLGFGKGMLVILNTAS
jgi:cell division protein FtsN